MERIEFIYFNAGGGHRATAESLQEVIRLQKRRWQADLVNLFEVLDPENRLQAWTRHSPEDFYNARLANGHTFGMGMELRLLQQGIRAAHPWLVRRLVDHWRRSQPDLVVSLVPNFNRALRQSLAQVCPQTPYVTLMTDLADLPPRFWIEQGMDQHVICGTPQALSQARRAGIPVEALHLTSGMVIRPSFYAPAPTSACRARARQALGLDPDRLTGVVMYGAHGSAAMLDIARVLPDTQLLLMCGHNESLAGQLNSLRRLAPLATVGYTRDVAGKMQMADFFIGKPGPGCLSEAIRLGLPVLTFHNGSTMPQERFNAQWVREVGVGHALASVRQLPEGLRSLQQDWGTYMSRTRMQNNRAVFEVPEILDALLRSQRARTQRTQPPLQEMARAA